MICSGCYRDVPDLVDLDHDLCCECLGIDPEFLVPSLCPPAVALRGDSESFWDEFTAAFHAYVEASSFEESAGLRDTPPEGLDWEDLPTFDGSPRF